MIRVLIVNEKTVTADALLQVFDDSPMESHLELRQPGPDLEQVEYRDWDAMIFCPAQRISTADFKRLARPLPRAFPAWVVMEGASPQYGIAAVAAGLAGCLDVKDRHILPALVVREVLCRGWSSYQRNDSPAAYSRSHRFMAQVINTLPYDIVVRDGTSKILFCNDSFAASYGLQAQDLIGRLDRDLWADLGRPEEQIREWLAEDQQILRTNQDREYIQRIERSTGETVFIHNIKQVITLADGTRCILGMYTDVTERRRIEDRLARAQSQAMELNAVRKTAATYAHEINNPLTGILGLVQLILEDPGLDAESADLLKQVVKAANRIKDVIRRMGTLSSTQSRPYLDRGEIIDLRDKPDNMVG